MVNGQKQEHPHTPTTNRQHLSGIMTDLRDDARGHSTSTETNKKEELFRPKSIIPLQTNLTSITTVQKIANKPNLSPAFPLPPSGTHQTINTTPTVPAKLSYCDSLLCCSFVHAKANAPPTQRAYHHSYLPQHSSLLRRRDESSFIIHHPITSKSTIIQFSFKSSPRRGLTLPPASLRIH